MVLKRNNHQKPTCFQTLTFQTFPVHNKKYFFRMMTKYVVSIKNFKFRLNFLFYNIIFCFLDCFFCLHRFCQCWNHCSIRFNLQRSYNQPCRGSTFDCSSSSCGSCSSNCSIYRSHCVIIHCTVQSLLSFAISP